MKRTFRNSLLWIALAILSCPVPSRAQLPISGSNGVEYLRDSVTEMSFDYKNRMIILKASFNDGRNFFDFILDSGAPTVITTQVLSTFTAQSFISQDIADFNGNVYALNGYLADDVLIGDKVYHRQNVLSSEFADEMPALKNYSSGGFIGADVMKHGIWMIDYQNKKIFVADKIEDFHLPDLVVRIPMSENESGSPYIKITLPGNKRIKVLVDLGCNKGVVLPQMLWKDEMSSAAPQQKTQMIVTTGYKTNCLVMDTGELSFIDIGFLRTDRIPVLLTSSNHPPVIGNQFLENYTVIFDFIHHQFILIPLIQSATPAL